MTDLARMWLIWSAVWGSIAFLLALGDARPAAGLVALGLSWVCLGYAEREQNDA